MPTLRLIRGSLRVLLALGILLPFIILGGGVHADTYPSKPIRMIVPFPAGGGLDTVGRVVARALSERLSVAVAVDNRGAPQE